MTLNEGIQQQGKPFAIPHSSRDELPQFLFDRGYRVGAEIGVYRGDYSKQFCDAGLKMYAIDSWEPVRNQGVRMRRQEFHDENYEAAKRTLAGSDCQIIKASSMEALRHFKNRTLDFVYIDGNHSLPYVLDDIMWWESKVRPGGIVAGHDYFNLMKTALGGTAVHVKYAVDLCVEVLGIENFYIFGGNRRGRKQMDACLSWMWVKP